MRQSRHLLVTNLPENITEDRILDHFKRFGKVQSVKFLPGSSCSSRKSGCSDTTTTTQSSSSNICATVAFIDIRSAAKALNNPDNKIEDTILKTEYYEPPASSTSSSAIFIHETREDALLVQRQSSSSSTSGYNNSSQVTTSSSSQLTSTTSSTLSYSTNTSSNTTSNINNNNSSNITSYASPNNNSSSSSQITPASNISSSSVFLQTSHGSNVTSATIAASSTVPSSLAVAVPSIASASSTRTASSSSSTPQRLHHLTTSRSCSKEIVVAGSNSQIHQPSSHTIGGNGSNPESSSILDRDYDHHKSFSTSHSICVRNLPVRSSDTSLKDGLYHEYKKHGKVTLVKVVGSGPDRFAIVCFKKPEDVEKALEVSKDKLFFGCKIEVTAQERQSRRPLWSSTDSEPRNSLSHSSPGKSRSQIQSMSPPPQGVRNDKDGKRIVKTPRSPASSRSSSVGGDIPDSDLISRKSSLEDTIDFQKENQKRFTSSSLIADAINDSRDTHKRRLEDDTDSLSDDPDQRHQERKKRLLACIEPKNVAGKDRPTTSSSRSSFEGARTIKNSQSIESSGDDLAEEVLEIVRNKQINLKDVTDKTLLTILERLSAENVDASRSSSDGSDSRPNRSQSDRKKSDKSYPRVNLNEDRVNPSLTDPRRRPPCETWVTNCSSPPHLLNTSCRDHPSIKRQQNISEPSVDSTGMSSPKDVSLTSLKSECDDLVSSSSDRPPAKTPMTLPLPEFAVLMLGASSFTNSSSLIISSKIEHLVPGSVQTVIAPLVIHGHTSLTTSPKNISITSPLNTFSPLPGKRLRESTDSKGSEVSTSDRDSLEAVNDSIVIKQEGGGGVTIGAFDKCSSPTKGSTAISGDLSIEDRIRALDKKFTAWSSSTTTAVLAPTATVSSCPVPTAVSMRQESIPPAPTIDYSKYHIKKKSQVNTSTSGDGSSRNEPSEIGKFFMSKTSIFDQDSKRLEHINEKYEPKDTTSTIETTPVQRTVIRTKAEAKEFAPPIDRTSSSSSDFRSKAPNAPHSHPSLGTIQRKLSEPSKMPPSSNLKREVPIGPTTPQSAPARPSSTAFGLFPSSSCSTPTEPASGKSSIVPVKKEGPPIGNEKGPRDPRRELQPENKGHIVKKEGTPLPVNPGSSTKKDCTLHGKESLKGNYLKHVATSSSAIPSSSGAGRGPLNVPSHAKMETGKSISIKVTDSENITKGRRISSDLSGETGGEDDIPPKNSSSNNSSDGKVKSKPMMMGLSKESLENSTKKKAKEGKSISYDASKSLERTKSFEKSLKKFEKNVSDSKNGKVSESSKNVSGDSKTSLLSKSSFKDKQKQLMEKSKLRAAKLKEKQKEKEKAEEKKRKNRKYASELKKLGIDLSDPPVFHSMYDKVKQRSCQKAVCPPEPSTKQSKSDSKSSKHDDSSDSSDSDSSSSSSDESDKAQTGKKRVMKRVAIASSSSSTSASSSSDEKSKKTKPKHSKSHNSLNKTSSKISRVVESESDSDDDNRVKSVKVKKGKKKMKQQQQQSKSYSSGDSSSDSDSPASKPVVKRAKIKSKSSSSDELEMKEKKSKSGLDMSKVKKQQMLMKEKMMKKSLEKSSSSLSKNLLTPSKGKADMRDTKTGKSSSFSSLSMLKRLKDGKKIPKGEKKERDIVKGKDHQIRAKSESDGKSHFESKSSPSKSSKKLKISDFKKVENVGSKKEKMVSEKKSSFPSRDKSVSLSSSSSSEKHNSSDNEMRSDFSDSERNFRRLEKVMQSDSDETENYSRKNRPSKHSHSKSSMSSGVISQTEWERSECGKSSSSHRHQTDDSVPPKSSTHSNTGFKSPKKAATHSPEIHSEKEIPSSSKMEKDIIDRTERRSPSPIERRKSISSSSPSELNRYRRMSPTPVVSSTSDIIPTKLDFHDDSSSSSSEDKLNEDLSKEARLSAERAEHLAESDASNDDLIIPDPPILSAQNKEEKQNRRFEEEAAIESQRLEKMMYEHSFNFNHDEDDQDPSESDANSIFSNDLKQIEIKDQSIDDGSNFGDFEPRSHGGKEVEVDQRLIEEASAVTALLQEMEYPETSTIEAESAVDSIPYIGIETDDEQNSLQIVEESEGEINVQPEKVISPARRSSREESTANEDSGLESGQITKSDEIHSHSNKSLSLAPALESQHSPSLVNVPVLARRSSDEPSSEQEKHKLVSENKTNLEMLPETDSVSSSPVKPVDDTSQLNSHLQSKQEPDASEDIESNNKDDMKFDGPKEQERPRRGRRPKSQKLVDPNSSALASNTEVNSDCTPETSTISVTTPSKRVHIKGQIPAEKVRRSPRVAGLAELESGQHETPEESGDDSTVRTSGAEDHCDDGEVQKKKRGRKKKVSGDVPKTDSNDGKLQKERVVVIPASTVSEKAVTERKNLSAYDVFEFRDSDDEMPPPLPIEIVQQTPGDPPKVVDDKKPEEIGATCEPETVPHEVINSSTETDAHPKISMIIRFNDEKSGTAEVIKTSNALNPDLTKATTATSTVSSALPTVTSLATNAAIQEDAAAEQARAIRKSARLMSQNKNTVDEVIEDVIKGMNKEGPEAFNARYRRLSRLSRRSEDSLADLDEELFEDPDSRDGKTGSAKTYRVTRSSTRGSTGSEESETHSVADEASQITQRRHSHPTPSEITENLQRSSIEKELVEETSTSKRFESEETICPPVILQAPESSSPALPSPAGNVVRSDKDDKKSESRGIVDYCVPDEEQPRLNQDSVPPPVISGDAETPSHFAIDKDDKKIVSRGMVDYRVPDEEQRRLNPDSMPPPVVSSLRVPLPGYPDVLGQRHPPLLSPHDRFTDSPAVIHGYQGNRCIPPSVIVRPVDVPLHVSPAAKNDDRRHQQSYSSHPQNSPQPEQSSSLARSQPLPAVGSPAPGYLDIRPAHQLALSPGPHPFQRSNIPSPMQSIDSARKSGNMPSYGHKDLNVPLSLNLSSPHGQGYHVNPNQVGSEHREEGLLRRAYPLPHPHLASDATLPPLGPPPAHISAPISQPMLATQTYPQAHVPAPISQSMMGPQTFPHVHVPAAISQPVMAPQTFLQAHVPSPISQSMMAPRKFLKAHVPAPISQSMIASRTFPQAHVPAPISRPMVSPQTFPQAQVPSGGDSFLLQRYPVVWQGLLALKNDQAAVQMHFISGSKEIAQASLPPIIPEEGVASLVRISQRMRLEPTQLEGVAKKMQSITEHCILLALPCGRDHMDVLQQSNNLKNGFINYFQSKQAAGIVNSTAPGSQTHAYVIHIFPSSEFSSGNMARIAPDLLHTVSDIAHLMIVIATV